jgi:hydroxymethylbilane synthase
MANANRSIRIATRQSRLALWQAEYVAAALREKHPELDVVLVPMTTQGDRIVDRSLAEVGGKGLFIKELERAIEEDRADIAVHSMKDVPSELPPGMALAAMLPRADARDAFISNRYAKFENLPLGARVGTSSPRRQCQIQHRRADLQILNLRGNVETRLRKLDAGEYDAIILASAGLTRLGLAARITEYLDFDLSLPAAGQGVIGIECRADDQWSLEAARPLDHLPSSQCCEAERAFARRLQGNCFSPIAAFAELGENTLRLRGAVGSMDGRTLFRDSIAGPVRDGQQLAIELAERMLNAGAQALLDEQRAREAQSMR